MYLYPSIDGSNKAPHLPCIAFEKYDGSNLRWEWNRKQGWSKFGTRRCLFDSTHEDFAPAIPIFMEKYAEQIEKIITDSKDFRNVDSVTAFTEFLGPSSFAGQHVRGEKKDLILFDFQVHRKGLLGPREFLDTFNKLHIAKVVYEGNLGPQFIEEVRQGQYGAGEGVVCKGGKGHKLWMVKIKTNAYLEKLKNFKPTDWQQFWE